MLSRCHHGPWRGHRGGAAHWPGLTFTVPPKRCKVKADTQGVAAMNEGHVEQDLPDNIDEFDVSIFDESELSDPAALALALEPGNPLKREIVLEAPPPARARGRTAVSSGAGPSKRRKRALACPVCVM